MLYNSKNKYLCIAPFFCMTDLDYSVGFSHFVGIGPAKFTLLLRQFGSAERAYHADLLELTPILGRKCAYDFLTFRSRFFPEKRRREIEDQGITILSRQSKLYPPQFTHLPDSPICVYVKGSCSAKDFEEARLFAIVGTRKPSTYGRQVAHTFGKELAEAGFTVVSGLALGIDAAAHAGCLVGKGKTIAVLGCGVDMIYPPANKGLYAEILTSGGMILSEFPPGMQVQKGLFVSRNRLVSGLSRGVLVVEGLKDSGALITARLAAEQGKEVFAPPVPLTSSLSEAPNSLIKEGATFVTSVQDILDSFNLYVTPHKEQDTLSQLSPEEQKIYSLLLREPLRSDDIAAEIGKPIPFVLPTLTILEVKGIVVKNDEGKVELRR